MLFLRNEPFSNGRIQVKDERAHMGVPFQGMNFRSWRNSLASPLWRVYDRKKPLKWIQPWGFT